MLSKALNKTLRPTGATRAGPVVPGHVRGQGGAGLSARAIQSGRCLRMSQTTIKPPCSPASARSRKRARGHSGRRFVGNTWRHRCRRFQRTATQPFSNRPTLARKLCYMGSHISPAHQAPVPQLQNPGTGIHATWQRRVSPSPPTCMHVPGA